MTDKLKGTGVALVTPFKENGAIDFNALQKLLEFTYAQGEGVNYWVVMGTTGEVATLNSKEKNQVLEFIKQNNPHNIPIVYGIGGNNTEALKETMDNTDFDLVEAILSVSPYYNKPSQEGIYIHYTSLADYAPRPLILYNVPARTSSNISAETTLRLATHSNIIGIKEASGDLVQCMKIVQNKPQDFLLLSGDDMLAIPMISIGGEGVISVLANAFPSLFAGMIRKAFKQEFSLASRNLYQLLDINPLMYQESNPVGVKEALAQQGVIENYVRLPLLSASEGLKEKIKNNLPL